MVSPTPEVIHDQLSAARLLLKKWEPEPWPPMDFAVDRKPTTPSEWFSKMFPAHARIWGCPFIELVQDLSDGLKRVNPMAQNLDFLGAILGGDEKMGHKVIYLEGEMQWYYLDQPSNIFKPTTDEKLANQLRALLIRCAEELPDTVHKLNLFLEFRSDKAIRAVVHRAKSILAADHTFFSVESKHQRQKGPEIRLIRQVCVLTRARHRA
jgi:NAD-dependent SIR2 family protein deacetylase